MVITKKKQKLFESLLFNQVLINWEKYGDWAESQGYTINKKELCRRQKLKN